MSRNRLPWYDPSEAVHPAVHRLKEAMFHAAITGDMEREPVPPPHPDITKFFERPKRVASRSKGAVEQCVNVFGITKGVNSSSNSFRGGDLTYWQRYPRRAVPPRVPFRKRKVQDEELPEAADVPLTLSDLLGGDGFVSAWNADADGALEPSHRPTAVKREDDEAMLVDRRPSASSGEGQPMVVGEGARDKRIIGNVHPLYDFEQNTARGDVVTKAVADMGKVIPEIVAESFSTQRFDEALDCMRIMRKTALEVWLPDPSRMNL